MPNSHFSVTSAEISKAVMACTMTMLAVSTVFMTQSIFLEISQVFNIDIAQARFSFSVASLFYAASFLFLGPLADHYSLPKMAVTGLGLLAMAVLLASYATDFRMFIIAMAFMGTFAAWIPASMFPHMALIAPPQKMVLIKKDQNKLCAKPSTLLPKFSKNR